MSRSENARAVHSLRRDKTKSRARKAVADLSRAGVGITFASVSRASGLSVGALYYHDDIKTEIIRAREESRDLSASKAVSMGIGSAKEMHAEVLRLRKRVSDLEEERDWFYDVHLEPCWEYDLGDA